MTDDDSKKAEQGIVTALQSYPLYRPFRYKARLKLERSTGGGAGLPLSRIEYLLLPQEIELHCSQCNKTQRWQLKDSPEIFELDLKQARLDHARETSQFIDLAEEFSTP